MDTAYVALKKLANSGVLAVAVIIFTSAPFFAIFHCYYADD